MNRITTTLLVTFAVLLGGLLARPLFSPAPAQAQSARGGAVGRYQIEVTGNGPFYFLDTQTGRIWYRSYQVEGGQFVLKGDERVIRWVEMDSPVSKAK